MSVFLCSWYPGNVGNLISFIYLVSRKYRKSNFLYFPLRAGKQWELHPPLTHVGVELLLLHALEETDLLVCFVERSQICLKVLSGMESAPPKLQHDVHLCMLLVCVDGFLNMQVL